MRRWSRCGGHHIPTPFIDVRRGLRMGHALHPIGNDEFVRASVRVRECDDRSRWYRQPLRTRCLGRVPQNYGEGQIVRMRHRIGTMITMTMMNPIVVKLVTGSAVVYRRMTCKMRIHDGKQSCVSGACLCHSPLLGTMMSYVPRGLSRSRKLSMVPTVGLSMWSCHDDCS